MFKNATFYRFPPAVGLDVLYRLGDAIRLLPLLDLEPSQMGVDGFVPLGFVDELAYWIGMACYVTIAVRSRVISPAMVSELLAKRVKEREDEEGRKVGSKERRRMKEEIIVDLMPHAPIVTKRTECLVHAGENWIAINTASPRVAEHCVGMLRQALGSFPATPLAPQRLPMADLTVWLSDAIFAPGIFIESKWAFGDNCLLVVEDGAKAAYRNQELTSDEITRNLADGKQVAQLGVVMRNAVIATLTTDLTLKSIQFLEGAGFDDAESQAQVMALQALELERVAHDLFSIFRCEEPG